MRSISRFFTRISGLPALIVCLALFSASAWYILPALGSLMGTIGGNQVSPDTLLYYTGDTLRKIALDYGEAGRSGYIRSALALDLVWPLVYVTAFSVAISFFGNIGFAKGSRRKRINLVPLSAGIFDLLENTSVSVVMAAFPDIPEPFAHLAGIFTAAKWAAVLASSLALIFAAISAGISLRRQKFPS